MKKLSLAYFGTPDFSARLLEKIIKDKNLPVEVKIVVTQPDKKVGRKQVVTKSPVKGIAEKYGILVLDTQFLTRKGALPRIREVPVSQKLVSSHLNVDLALLFAYGEIIPKELLSVPKYGFWNVHPSLLPKYRGASPVAFPLMAGDKETGVTLLQMDDKMDHGPTIVQERVTILPKEKRDELTERLADVAFGLLQKPIVELAEGLTVYTQAQNETEATYTKLLMKQDGFIDLLEIKNKIIDSPEELFNRFRGLYPWPGLWTEVDINGEKRRLKITDMNFKNGQLDLLKVQLEGKNEMNFAQFNAAYKLF